MLDTSIASGEMIKESLYKTLYLVLRSRSCVVWVCGHPYMSIDATRGSPTFQTHFPLPMATASKDQKAKVRFLQLKCFPPINQVPSPARCAPSSPAPLPEPWRSVRIPLASVTRFPTLTCASNYLSSGVYGSFVAPLRVPLS